MSVVRNNYPISYVKRSTTRRPSSKRRLNTSVSPSEHSVVNSRSTKKKKKKKAKKKNAQELVSTRKTNPNTSHKKTESEDSFYSIPSDSLEKHQLSSRVSSKKKKKSNFSNESSKTIPTVSSRGGTQEPWSDGR